MKIISTSSQNLAFRTLHLYFYTLILFRYSPRYVFPRVSRCPVKLGKGGEKGFMIRACLGEKMSQLLSTKTWLPSYIWLLCRLITFCLALFDIMFVTKRLSLFAKITKRRVWWPCSLTSQAAKAELKMNQWNTRSKRSILFHRVN